MTVTKLDRANSSSRLLFLPLALSSLGACGGDPSIASNAGMLDESFGVGGIVDIEIGSGYASALERHGDGLVGCASLVSGDATSASVFRIRLDGSPDFDFGPVGTKAFTNAETDQCVDLAVADDGTIAALVRTPTGDALALRSPEGTWAPLEPLDDATYRYRSITAAGSGFWLAGRALVNEVARPALHFWPLGDGMESTTVSMNLEGEGYRAFGTAAGGVEVVGRISYSGSAEGWTVLTSADGTSALDDAGFHVNRGEGWPEDLLMGAVRIEEGRFVAFGSQDLMTAVQSALLDLDEPDVENVHSFVHGGPSGAYGGVVDERGRTLLVGQATTHGTTAFGWSRLAADGLGLDPGFANNGWNEAVTPNGTPGELIDVTIGADGAYYALGHYDVAATPKIALLRIER